MTRGPAVTPSPAVREALDALKEAHRDLFDRGWDPEKVESALLAAHKADVLAELANQPEEETMRQAVEACILANECDNHRADGGTLTGEPVSACRWCRPTAEKHVAAAARLLLAPLAAKVAQLEGQLREADAKWWHTEAARQAADEDADEAELERNEAIRRAEAAEAEVATLTARLQTAERMLHDEGRHAMDLAERLTTTQAREAALVGLWKWVESTNTLHNTVEFLYVVDGFNADYVTHDGATTVASAHGKTLVEATQNLRALLTGAPHGD